MGCHLDELPQRALLFVQASSDRLLGIVQVSPYTRTLVKGQRRKPPPIGCEFVFGIALERHEMRPHRLGRRDLRRRWKSQ